VRLILSFFLLLGFDVWAQNQKTEVRFHELTTVRMNEPVYLPQVATVRDASSDLMTKLNAIVVHEGVSSEGLQEIRNQELVASLRQKLSFADSQKIVFKIPNEVKFKASRSHIYTNDLIHAVIEQAQVVCGPNCVIDVEDFHLPLIATTTEVISYKLDTRAFRQPGSFVLPFVVETSKGRQNLWVTGSAKFRKQALVATRMLKIGEKVSAQDFREELVDVSQSKDGVPTLENLQGRIISRPVHIGQTLFFSDLKAVNAALRGEPVKIILGDEVYEVSMMGVAEQNGAMGDSIKVKTPDKKVLLGELIEDRVVRVK
jgi:flagella basal body P-ring formation protein FlgA